MPVITLQEFMDEPERNWREAVRIARHRRSLRGLWRRARARAVVYH